MSEGFCFEVVTFLFKKLVTVGIMLNFVLPSWLMALGSLKFIYLKIKNKKETKLKKPSLRRKLSFVICLHYNLLIALDFSVSNHVKW